MNFFVQVYFSFLAMPLLPIADSHTGMVLSLIVADALAAILSAALLATPLSLIVKKWPVLLADALTIGTTLEAANSWDGAFADVAALLRHPIVVATSRASHRWRLTCLLI